MPGKWKLWSTTLTVTRFSAIYLNHRRSHKLVSFIHINDVQECQCHLFKSTTLTKSSVIYSSPQLRDHKQMLAQGRKRNGMLNAREHQVVKLHALFGATQCHRLTGWFCCQVVAKSGQSRDVCAIRLDNCVFTIVPVVANPQHSMFSSYPWERIRCVEGGVN